jgi:formate--tetrahydrofolate ligase
MENGSFIRPIGEIARRAGIEEEELHPYGKHVAKVDLSLLHRKRSAPDGRLIVVTAISPTPLGEGKTVTSIGLGLGLARRGVKVINTLREPSKGPTFGVKGGACGGGRSMVLPMETINLHFTGDIPAVEGAQNLLAALVDSHLYHGNTLELDPLSIDCRRCVDVNDRTLRRAIVGLGGRPHGLPRETGFDITAATEAAALLALCEGYADLRDRIGRMLVGFTRGGKPVTVEQVGAAGAMAALLRDAVMPNLVQSSEGTPVLVHGFPFANIAHGCNSVIADRMALKLGDVVVTEAGFGSDCGFEKFVNVKARQSGLTVSLAVIVASVRALKMHGGAFPITPGRIPDPELVAKENLPALDKGCRNLARHIGIIRAFGIPAVVAVNRFAGDTDAELDLVLWRAREAGAAGAAFSTCFADGGAGAEALADECLGILSGGPAQMSFLYPDEASIEEKITAVATKIYGAGRVEFTAAARKRMAQYTALGWGHLPVNIAKTQFSLSHDPSLKNAPEGFDFPIVDIRASLGAGFLYPLAGEIQTLPGFPPSPTAHRVDLTPDGRIIGLF